jgi:hypothetical protein
MYILQSHVRYVLTFLSHATQQRLPRLLVYPLAQYGPTSLIQDEQGF